MSPPDFVAIDIGHSRTAVAAVNAGTLETPRLMDDQSLGCVMPAIGEAMAALGEDPSPPIVIASVHEPMCESLCSTLRDQVGERIYVIGEDLPVPLVQDLAPEAVPGVDRLLAALAAWDTLQHACVVVDAGTAITVDFVDGQGTFHGGAIAPGLRMQLDALHRGTTSLPDLDPVAPAEAETFGRSTADAMQLGVFAGIRGMVRHLAERYATAYDAWPPIVVTGGDAETLFKDDELIDRIVPDLVLRGIVAAATRVLAPGDAAS